MYNRLGESGGQGAAYTAIIMMMVMMMTMVMMMMAFAKYCDEKNLYLLENIVFESLTLKAEMMLLGATSSVESYCLQRKS